MRSINLVIDYNIMIIDFQVISKDLDVNSEYFRNGLTDKFGLPQLRNNDAQ